MDSKYITIGKKTSSRCYDSEEWHEEKQGKTESELRIATRERHILPLLPLPFPHFHFFSLLFSSLFCWLLPTIWMPGTSWALFRHRSFHELNLIDQIKYMKSSASESILGTSISIWNGSGVLHNYGKALEWLWSRHRTFQIPNLMHKL